MKRFVLGMDRIQSTLLPDCLDDFIDESNPVRAIDAFVDALNLGPQLQHQPRPSGGRVVVTIGRASFRAMAHPP
jgi:hypothetical protein